MKTTLLTLSLLLLTGCSAFDQGLDMAALAGQVAVHGGYLKADDAEKLAIAIDVARTASAEAQGKAEVAAASAESARERIEAVAKETGEESDLNFWLAIAAAAGVVLRGAPSKGVGGAVARAAGRVFTPPPSHQPQG